MDVDRIRRVLLKKREEKGLSAQALGKQVGVDKTTIYRYEKGQIEKMPFTVVNRLAEILNINPTFIAGFTDDPDINKNAESDLEIKISNLVKRLNVPRQKKIYDFANAEYQKQVNDNVLSFPQKEKLPTIQNSSTAANPTELAYGDTVVEEEEFESVPKSADFAVPVMGDSMEPRIRNGQLVFVKKQPDVEEGEIAIVEIEGDGVTCKVICKDFENKKVILHSINEKYKDRIVSPEQIRIIGKVVF